LKSQIKSEIQSGINPKELVLITFSKKEIHLAQLLDSGNEIRFKDKLYDIVRSTETVNSISFYCIGDHQEDDLLASLDEHINLHVASNKPLKNSKNLIHHFAKLYYSLINSLQFSLEESSPSLLTYTDSYNSTAIEITAPPPEFA